MKVYISKTMARMDAFIKGMTANSTDWTGQPVTLAIMTGDRTKLLAASNHIDDTSSALKEANSQGAVDNTVSKRYLAQAETLAYGIYADNPAKLSEYGLKPRKDPTKIPPPTSTLAITITDDSDGEGFILTIASIDALADSYEWQKGQGTDPKDTSTIPLMHFYKNTSKSEIVDDDILTGIRYFYRVRAVNRNGQGPWSDVCSRVQ